MIIDGRVLAEKKIQIIKKQVTLLKKKNLMPLCLAIVARQDPEGLFYTKIKAKVAKKAGIEYQADFFSLTPKKEREKVFNLIKKANKNKKISGIIIQKPGQETIKKYFKTDILFKNFWLEAVSQIDPKKDLDCLTPENLGRLLIGNTFVLPATVRSVWEIIIFCLNSKENIAGKNILIVGSSEILGKPLAILLRDHGGTVCMAGSRTKNFKQLCFWADIIVSCVGKPKLITKSMVKPKSLVIDAGTRAINGRVYGDVDYLNIAKIADVTPVPGGVGPLTVACLLENLMICFKNQFKEKQK